MTATTTTSHLFNLTGSLRLRPELLWKAGAGLALAGGLWLAQQPILSFVELTKDRDNLTQLVQAYGAWGPAVLVITIMLQVIVAVLPGHVLMLAGGYLYGPVAGFFITWCSTTAASQVNFYLARKFGRKLIDRLAPSGLLGKWLALAQDQGFGFFLAMFGLPVFPSDMMAYVAGLTKISTRRFLAANLLGHLPCAIVAALVGAYGLSVPWQIWASLGVIVVLVAVLWKLLAKRLVGADMLAALNG